MRLAKGLSWLGWMTAAWALSGCDQLGVETPAKAAERQIAEAKAIGGGCRHAMRAIEDCYSLNPKADKSSVFTGWREMDEYMRENKLDGIAPVVPRPSLAASKAKPKNSEDDEDEEVVDASTSSTRGATGKPSAGSERADSGEAGNASSPDTKSSGSGSSKKPSEIRKRAAPTEPAATDAAGASGPK